MKWFRLTQLCFLIFVLTSCAKKDDACEGKDIYCLGIPETYELKYSLPKEDDTIRYFNEKGNGVGFLVVNYYKSESYISECEDRGISLSPGPSVYANPCGPANWYYRANTLGYGQSQWNLEHGIFTEIKFEADSGLQTVTSYGVLGYQHKYVDGNEPKGSEKLLESVNLGGHEYEDVRLHSLDTNNLLPITNATKWVIWQTYFHPHHGIIAFHDLKSHTLFVKE